MSEDNKLQASQSEQTPSQNPSQQPPMLAQQQGMMPQQQGMMPPQQGMMPPQQGMMPPQQGMMPQQQGMMPQQQGMMPQQQGMMPPQQGMMPPQTTIIYQNQPKKKKTATSLLSFIFFFLGVPISYYFQNEIIRMKLSLPQYIAKLPEIFAELPHEMSVRVVLVLVITCLVTSSIGKVIGTLIDRE